MSPCASHIPSSSVEMPLARIRGLSQPLTTAKCVASTRGFGWKKAMTKITIRIWYDDITRGAWTFDVDDGEDILTAESYPTKGEAVRRAKAWLKRNGVTDVTWDFVDESGG